MAIIKTIGKHEFIKEFKEIRPNNFTDEGLDYLYDYLDFQGENIELDVIALCCEYEQATTQDVIEMFRDHFEGVDPEDVSTFEAVQVLERETTVIRWDGYNDVIIFCSF